MERATVTVGQEGSDRRGAAGTAHELLLAVNERVGEEHLVSFQGSAGGQAVSEVPAACGRRVILTGEHGPARSRRGPRSLSLFTTASTVAHPSPLLPSVLFISTTGSKPLSTGTTPERGGRLAPSSAQPGA